MSQPTWWRGGRGLPSLIALLFMRSEIAANLNVLEFVKIFGEISKTLGALWSNRYGVTAP